MAEKIKEEIDTIKPTAVEPSVESIAERLLDKFCEDDLMSELKEGIVNALRNERNRK